VHAGAAAARAEPVCGLAQSLEVDTTMEAAEALGQAQASLFPPL